MDPGHGAPGHPPDNLSLPPSASANAAEPADVDLALYSGHSLRAGSVTTAAANGASERSIAHQTRHAPGSTMLRT